MQECVKVKGLVADVVNTKLGLDRLSGQLDSVNQREIKRPQLAVLLRDQGVIQAELSGDGVGIVGRVEQLPQRDSCKAYIPNEERKGVSLLVVISIALVATSNN